MSAQSNAAVLDAALSMMEDIIDKMRARTLGRNPVLYFHYVQEPEDATPRRLHVEIVLDISEVPKAH